MRLFLVLASLLALAAPRADAAFITYHWVDNGISSTLFGSFTVDTGLLPGAPGGKALAAAGLVGSDFIFQRVAFGLSPGGSFVGYYQTQRPPVVGFEGVVIDPATGAVLTDGRVLFGESPLAFERLNPSSGFAIQVTGGYATLDTRYAEHEPFGGLGSQRAFLDQRTTLHGVVTGEATFDFLPGYWLVEVTPVPAPPALVTALAGLACLAARRLWR